MNSSTKTRRSERRLGSASLGDVVVLVGGGAVAAWGAYYLTSGNLLAVIWIAVSTALALWFGGALCALRSRETYSTEVETEEEVPELERQDAADVTPQPTLVLGQRLPDLPIWGDEEVFLGGYALHCSNDGIRIRTTDYHAAPLDLSWEKLLEWTGQAN